MSLLYHRHTKRALKYVWATIAVLIILSMVLFLAPGIWTTLFR